MLQKLYQYLSVREYGMAASSCACTRGGGPEGSQSTRPTPRI